MPPLRTSSEGGPFGRSCEGLRQTGDAHRAAGSLARCRQVLTWAVKSAERLGGTHHCRSGSHNRPRVGDLGACLRGSCR
jgi:hypothetical protein